MRIPVKKPTSQVESKRNRKKPFTYGLSPKIYSMSKYAQQELDSLKDASLLCANHAIELATLQSKFCYYRKYFADKFHISISTVKRVFILLRSLGLLETVEFWKKGQQFLLGSMVYNNFYRQSLVDLLPALRSAVFVVWLSVQSVSSHFDPHIIYKESSQKLIVNSSKKNNTISGNRYQQQQLEYLQQHLDTVFSVDTISAISQKRSIMLKSFQLTPAGEANLLPFCQSCISFADEQTFTALCKGPLKDPFGYFIKQCNQWYAERGMKPEWRKMYDAYQQQSINNNDSRIEKILISSKRTSTKSKAEKNSYSHDNPNPETYIDKQEACCYWIQLDEAGRYEYLRKQLGLRPQYIKHFDSNGWPLPLTSHYRDKLTCNHP